MTLELLRRLLTPVLVCLIALALQWRVWRKLRGARWVLASAAASRVLKWLHYALAALLVVVVPALFVARHPLLGPAAVSWLMAGVFLYSFLLMSAALWLARGPARDARGEPDAGRRAFLRAATGAGAALPALVGAAGLIGARMRPELVQVDIRIPRLHPDLDGLRIAQLSDIHYGPFFGRSDLEYAVAMANDARAHVTLVTGDLITRWGDDLEGCVQVLKALRGEAGVWGCLGNHERYAQVEDEATVLGAAAGMQFLRRQREVLRFGAARLNLIGVDYQQLGAPALVGVKPLVAAGAVNVLLSHTPAAFDRAAALGIDLTISGHTHGGQLNLQVGDENVTLARVFTPYVRGLYRKGGSQLYVNRGLGTVGAPLRIGARPEVSVIRLCAT